MLTDFPRISCAEDLLQSMKNHPTFIDNPPSNDVVAFLNRIENADPNSADIQDDDTNANWGHHQFTAASLTCSTVLDSLENIGSTEIACRLIASAIRTCKIARHLCFKRQVKTESYLSDAYLENLVERLWALWRASGGVIITSIYLFIILTIHNPASCQRKGFFCSVQQSPAPLYYHHSGFVIDANPSAPPTNHCREFYRPI